MTRRQGSRLRRRLVYSGFLILAVVAGVATKGPPPPVPNPPGSFSFAALGDAPYYPWEEIRFRLVLQDLDAHDLNLVLHVGDLFWRPCSDERYQRSFEQMQSLRHPVVYTPGDNEWTDCWEPRVGGFVPLDRLDRLRGIFFADPGRSLGGAPRALVSQAADTEFAEFVENVRWTDEEIVFATMHMVGSWNSRDDFPGRTAADDQASVRRTDAATAWLRETFEEARTSNAPAVVLAIHANPGFEEPPTDAYRRNYEPFIEVLEEEVHQFARPVLLVHGDDHEFVVDSPLVRRATGRRLDNLTRMQVPGSPEVGWVRVVVNTGEPVSFAFDPRVVPSWKYW
jgi:hypothetical protein